MIDISDSLDGLRVPEMQWGSCLGFGRDGGGMLISLACGLT
jgi:hypothetical protein